MITAIQRQGAAIRIGQRAWITNCASRLLGERSQRALRCYGFSSRNLPAEAGDGRARNARDRMNQRTG
jgi:hypothetical protein